MLYGGSGDTYGAVGGTYGDLSAGQAQPTPWRNFDSRSAVAQVSDSRSTVAQISDGDDGSSR